MNMHLASRVLLCQGRTILSTYSKKVYLTVCKRIFICNGQLGSNKPAFIINSYCICIAYKINMSYSRFNQNLLFLLYKSLLEESMILTDLFIFILRIYSSFAGLVYGHAHTVLKLSFYTPAS